MTTDTPKPYQRLKATYGAYMDAVESLGKAARASGPLDEKTAQLLQLTAAAALRSEGAVHSHARRAVKCGASAEEVRHALLLLTSTIGFPNVVAAMSWVDDVLEGGSKS